MTISINQIITFMFAVNFFIHKILIMNKISHLRKMYRSKICLTSGLIVSNASFYFSNFAIFYSQVLLLKWWLIAKWFSSEYFPCFRMWASFGSSFSIYVILNVSFVSFLLRFRMSVSINKAICNFPMILKFNAV